MPNRRGASAAFAGVTAALGWTSLVIELVRSVSGSLGKGLGLAEALFLYFRFFTILTNLGIAILMTVTAIRLFKRQALPPARVFNAALVYILVTCATYELMLRSRWSPHGLQIATDTVFHDIVPAFMLVSWLAFAPREGLRWRDAIWVLAFPAAYFATTLAAGALGEGYPYHFINVDKLGYPAVLVTAALFLALFYVLALLVTAVGKLATRSTE